MERKLAFRIPRALLALAVAILLFAALPAGAQVDTGTIVGKVADSSGALIKGAKVTLKNEGTGVSLSTTTSADGLYQFTPVRIGTYTLEASASGFQTVSQLHVTVYVASNLQINFTLPPGSVSQTVEVTAAAPVL